MALSRELFGSMKQEDYNAAEEENTNIESINTLPNGETPAEKAKKVISSKIAPFKNTPPTSNPLPKPKLSVVWDANKELSENAGKPMLEAKNSLASLSKQAATEIGVDPSMLLASAWVEGGNKQAMKGNYTSPLYDKAFPTQEAFEQFPVDGFAAYGIDTIGDKWDKVKKFLPAGFEKRLKFYTNTNEQGQKVKSAGFDSDQAALMAKAAMLKYEEERVTDYAKKKGIELDDEAKKYFTMVSYNRGNAFTPIDEYASDKDKKTFISGGRTSKKEAHANVLKRMKSMESARELINKAGDVVED